MLLFEVLPRWRNRTYVRYICPQKENADIRYQTGGR